MAKILKGKGQGPLFIALIKYWGNIDNDLRIPRNDNLAINLDFIGTDTNVSFSPGFKEDRVVVNGKALEREKKLRVIRVVDIMRKRAKINWPVHIFSENHIPTASGIGSSASSFSDLVVAINKALKLNLTKKELSLMARLGSGSAARAIPSGFVLLPGNCSQSEAYARTLFPPSYWPLSIFIIILSDAQKHTLTTQGHLGASTSPLYKERQWGLKERLKEIIKTIRDKDIWRLGRLLEAEALSLHANIMSQSPPIFYWSPRTFRFVKDLVDYREKEGYPIFWTIDAGENLFLLTVPDYEDVVKTFISRHPEVKKYYLTHPGKGPR